MALVLTPLLCLASGFLIVCLGWPTALPIRSDLLLKGFLSVGYGLGLFSVIFFLSRVVGATNLILFDVVVCASLFLCLFLRRTRAKIAVSSWERERLAKPRWFQAVLTAAFVLALGAALYSGGMRTLAHPQGGGWDAFAIWNLHARFLFLAGVHWRDGFSPLLPWSHPDYPLLLPAAVAYFWTIVGNDAPSVPALIGLVFTFSTVGLLFSALGRLRGQTQAMLGAIALLATPAFIEVGTWQYADIPLSFFFLATIVLLCLHDESDSNTSSHSQGLLILAGLAAGFAAWTKNEGVLFLCAIVLSRLLVFHRDSRQPSPVPRASGIAQLGFLLSGIIPICLLIFYFKHFLAPRTDLFADPTNTLHKLETPARYSAVVSWYLKEFLRFGRWLVPTTLLILGYYFVAGREPRSRGHLALRCSLLALFLTLAGYFGIYLITPYDIYWHLRFSLGRLFLQVWPSVLFLFFLSVIGPDGQVLDTPVSNSNSTTSSGVSK